MKHSLRVGWRNFFPSCAVVSVFGSSGKQDLVYILMYLEYHTVVVLCQFLCFWREIVLVRTYLPYSCGVVLVFLVLAGNSFWCYVRTQYTIQLCSCVLKKWLFGFFIFRETTCQPKYISRKIQTIYDYVSLSCFL